MNPKLSECFHARSRLMFCDVRVCYRIMAVVVKAMHTTSQQFAQWCLNVQSEFFGIITDLQAIDVVTFDFVGTRVRCFVSGSTDYQMDYS